jgi:AcrR family transcriptional regulator
MDKRIIKTRQMLQEALLSLLREKPFESIEIQAITERANTARVTFYRHYATKEELLLDAIEQVYQLLQSQVAAIPIENALDFRQTPPSYFLFAFLEQDRMLHKKLFTGSVSALLQQRVRHYIVRQVTQTFSAAPRYADLPVGLVANHIASTVIGNIVWWLSEDVPYSAEYMARITHWMGLAGVMTVIGRGDDITLPPPDTWRMS